MTPLLDGDILPYEIGFGCEYNKDGIPSFDYVKEAVDGKIEEICKAVGATEPPLIFLTGKGNFREAIAEKKGYKANRKDSKKPFHFYNIRAYLEQSYGAVVCEGYEADDALAMHQTDNTIICSRDKDLRQVPGNHYSWECGKQGEIGPYVVDELGEWWTEKLPNELKGTGYRFFAAQCLMGDKVDNIPGLPGWGPVKTYEYLKDISSPEELIKAVLEAYKDRYLDTALAELELEEQAQLVWMVRGKDEDDNLIMWKLNA